MSKEWVSNHAPERRCLSLLLDTCTSRGVGGFSALMRQGREQKKTSKSKASLACVVSSFGSGFCSWAALVGTKARRSELECEEVWKGGGRCLQAVL